MCTFVIEFMHVGARIIKKNNENVFQTLPRNKETLYVEPTFKIFEICLLVTESPLP